MPYSFVNIENSVSIKEANEAFMEDVGRSDGLIISSIGANIRLVYFEPGEGTSQLPTNR